MKKRLRKIYNWLFRKKTEYQELMEIYEKLENATQSKLIVTKDGKLLYGSKYRIGEVGAIVEWQLTKDQKQSLEIESNLTIPVFGIYLKDEAE